MTETVLRVGRRALNSWDKVGNPNAYASHGEDRLGGTIPTRSNVQPCGSGGSGMAAALACPVVALANFLRMAVAEAVQML